MTFVLDKDESHCSRAARIRDQIESFEKAQRSTQGNLSDELDGDFIAIHEEGLHAAGSIFMLRRGSIKGSRSWIVNQELALEGDDQWASLLFSIYGGESTEIPSTIYLNSEPADTCCSFEFFARRCKFHFRLQRRK